MAETTYIVIDDLEKRVYTGHNQELNGVMAAISMNPNSIAVFNRYYRDLTGSGLYNDGNRPKVPEEISLDTIRTVLGMTDKSEEEVLQHWRKLSFYEDPNYKKFSPDEKTDFDIPELTQNIIDEWKQEDPDAEEFATANEYRRFLCNDGVVVADLRKKEVRYISRGVFDIPRSRPTTLDQEMRFDVLHYELPDDWNIVQE